MQVQLSSKFTFGFRYILPFMQLGFWVICTPFWIKSQGLIGLSGFAAFGLTYLFSRAMFFPLCTVLYDDNFLYVRNFSKTDKINLSNVESIEKQGFLNYCNIFFKKETKFGKSILFKLPRTSFMEQDSSFNDFKTKLKLTLK